jgi:hypothetical protein
MSVGESGGTVREHDPQRWFRKFCDLVTAYRIISEQNRMLRLPDERVREIREKKFLATVDYAYRNITLYRKRWDAAGISPADIRTLDDIGKLPIITKEDIRNGFPEETVSRSMNLADCLVFQTSGSAGEPCPVAWDRHFAIQFLAQTSPYFMGHYLSVDLKTAAYVVVIGRGTPCRRSRSITRKSVPSEVCSRRGPSPSSTPSNLPAGSLSSSTRPGPISSSVIPVSWR